MTAEELDRSGFELEFSDDFEGDELDRTKWLPRYLPHWTGPERSAARYSVAGGVLSLRIDADTPVWHPEVAPGMRVSSLQTGHFAGPVGSTVGQHRTDERLTVREQLPAEALYTPTRGLIEARIRALTDSSCMVAMWLIGVEHRPEDSAEICVFEIFGSDVRSDSAEVGVGVKAHGDPRVRTDFERVRLEGDATEWHQYSTAWTEESVRFYLDDRLVKTVPQRIQSPLQVMLNIYEFDAPEHPAAESYPKVFPVDFVRGYRPR